MYLDKDAILNSLTKEDVIKVVTTLGSSEPKTDSNGNLIFQTICHNVPDPGNSYKLYYYHEPNEKNTGKIFYCYTQCSEAFSIVELVIRANRTQGKNITWYKALYWIGKVTGKLISSSVDNIDDKDENFSNDFEWINRLKAAQKKKNKAPVLAEINENILDIFCYIPHEDWLNDHISREALGRFEIGYYGLTNQITIPHRDKNGRLIGIRGRFLNEEDVNRVGKYLPLEIAGRHLTHSLGSNLYGLNVVLQRVLATKKIMLVEAEKSCLQAYSYFGEDSFVVALCGSSITTTHIKIILSLGVEEVIVGLDREYHEADSWEAEAWMQKMLKKVKPLIPYVKVSICADSKNRLEYKDSPTDQGKKILLELLDEKIVVTLNDYEIDKKENSNENS
jgi:hypothetical protein